MLMDLSRIENETTELAQLPFAMDGMIRRVVERHERAASAKQIRVRIETVQDLPLAVADPGHSERVLANLLGNAISFTAVGGSIDVLAKRSRTRDGQLEVAVVDSGRGIAQAELERIFDRLYQVEPSVARDGGDSATSGLGLGLAISRRLAELQGGQLRVESEVGVGSTFTFSLPASRDAVPNGPGGRGEPG